jgi:hypothetical protein
MPLLVHLALLSLSSANADLYSKVDELKEPDWATVAEPSDLKLYYPLDDLKVPEWAATSEGTPADATTSNDELYAKLEDLKAPY